MKSGLIALIVAATIEAPLAYTIVRTDGSRVEALAAPEYKGGRALFRVKGGSLTFLSEPSVDKAATEKANLAPARAKPALKEESALPPAKPMPAGGHAKSSFSDDDIAVRSLIPADDAASAAADEAPASPGSDSASEAARLEGERDAKIAEHERERREEERAEREKAEELERRWSSHGRYRRRP